MISWVFFDLGGTVLDDSALVDAITRAYVELLNARGHPVSYEEFLDVRDLMIVRQEHPLFRSAATTFTRDPAATDAIWKEVAPRIQGVEVTGQHAFPGAADVLREASRHAGVGVIANQYRTVRDVLRREGLDGLFRILVISEEAGVSKPNPAIFERALREAGCKPQEAVMVGDRIDFDVEPARALGFHTVRIKWGPFRNQSPLRPGQVPDMEVTSLAEVPAALDRLARRA
ncbi:MAG TPA: HAD family hydrolase [Thermoplasmata archaeon]|nr:HAD family hydrolase [Thermoplasmata archaeon]